MGAALSAPGDLDNSFGTGGIVELIEPFASSNGSRVGIGIQSGGGIVAGGLQSSQSGVVIVRFNADGTVDSTFGDAGFARHADYYGGGEVAIEPDDKILSAGASNNALQLLRFSSNGLLEQYRESVVSSNAIYTWVSDILVQPNGKILLAGTTRMASSNDFLLARFNEDLTLDTSFGDGGWAITPIGNGYDVANSMAIDAEGRVLLVGLSYIESAAPPVMALTRHMPNGALDSTFGVGGIVTTALGTHRDTAESVAIQPDGKIIVTGSSRCTLSSCREDFATLRYLSDGSLDTSFGENGAVLTDIDGFDYANHIALQADDKILVAGNAGKGFALVRYSGDGSLDLDFGDAGISFVDGLDACCFLSATLDEAENIVLAEPRGDRLVMARFDVSAGQDEAACQGSVELANQSEIDEFGAQGCDTFLGDIRISGGSDLASLSQLTSISGWLTIEGTDLENLTGLDNLSSVGLGAEGGILISKTYKLQDLSALSSLESVGSLVLSLETTDGALTNISGFDSLIAADKIDIGTLNLVTLSGFSNLVSVRILAINNNPKLEQITAFANLKAVGQLLFAYNNKIQNFSFLSGLESIDWLRIHRNLGLISLDGLESVTIFDSDTVVKPDEPFGSFFWVSDNPLLSDLSALQMNSHEVHRMILSNNNSLRNVDGLNTLLVTADVSVYQNDFLENLIGLHLASDLRSLVVRTNGSLDSLNGLGSIQSVSEDLYVSSNFQLGDCSDIGVLLGWPEGPPADSVGGEIEIGNNASGCNSVSEILDSNVGPASYVVSPSVGSAGGTVAPAADQIVEEGGVVSFAFSPDADYELDSIAGTCGGTRSGVSFTTDPVTQDCTVIGYFAPTAPQTYTVTIGSGANGSTSPTGAQQISSGDQVPITVSPDEGYEVESIGGTCSVTQTGPLSYETQAIEADCSVEFSFHRSTFTVTPSSSLGGAITPGSAQQVPRGESATFTLLPDTDNEVSDVTGTCGGNLSGTVFTTSAIQADCSVSASFRMISGSAPPSKPALATKTVNKTAATLQITAGSAGSNPISNYTTECSVDDSVFRMSAKPRVMQLGFFSGDQQASPVSTQIGREFRANPDLFNLARGMVVRLDHDGGFSDFRIDRVTTTSRGNLFVASEITPSHWLQLLVRPDGNFFGSIVLAGKAYQAYVQSDETVFYSSEDGQLAPNPFADDALHENGVYIVSTGGVSEAVSNDPAVVTVGILVDNALARWSTEDLLGWIDLLMSSANAIYQDSGVDIAFVVADIVQYEPGSAFTIDQKLSQISCGSAYCQFGSGLNSAVTNWRVQVGADMVVQLIETGTGGTCGIGWIAPSLYYVADPNSLAYFTHSVSAYQNGDGDFCPANVVAHEMGHNFSLNHDLDQYLNEPPPPTVYPYGFGYKLPTGYGSMMSYPDSFERPFDGYLPYLSNPNIIVDGYPLGTPTNQANPAFAALSAQNLRSYYEQIINNGDISLAPPAPELESYTSTTSSVTLTFQPRRNIGQDEPNLFTANCSGATASSSSSPVTVSGLAAGSSYSCSVSASNQFGTGPASNSLTATTQAPASYTVTPSSGAGGSISPSSPQTVEAGDVASFSVTPSSGYEIASVTGCGGSLVGSIYTTAPVTGNCSVIASFAEQVNSYVVTPIAGAGGTLTPNEPQTVERGQSVAFTVTVEQGYRIKQVSGCNGTLNGTTYNTGPVTSSCDVSATFEAYWVVSGPSTTVSLTGLPEARKIQCTTFATNLAGNSPLSDIEYFVTGDPSKPSGVKIDRWDGGDEEISLYVSVGSNGGANVSSYEATCTDGTSSYTAVSNSSSITVTGLQNDVPYTCTAVAINSAGRSDDSPETPPIVPEWLSTGLPIWLLYEATK